MSLKTKTSCRLCESKSIHVVAEFSDLPLVDQFSKSPNEAPLYPCSLQECSACGHIQLSQVVDPEVLFEKDYLFQTSDYPWLVEHYRGMAEELFREFAPSFVLEIGSNDGTLGQMFQERGCIVLGVDPSSVPSRIPVLRERFGCETAKKLTYKADLVIANHVFAHNDDLRTIVEGVRMSLKPDGVFVFETNAGIDLLSKNLFDIVYHEHMDYHTVWPLIRFMADCGLVLFRVSYNKSKGGTLRGFACLPKSRGMEQSVFSASVDEKKQAVESGGWDGFNKRLQERRQRVQNELDYFSFIGYGAGAGGIATLYHLGLEKKIHSLVDDSPRRLHMYAPNCNAVVYDPKELYASPFLKCVILSWRYAESIKAKHPNLKLIVP